MRGSRRRRATLALGLAFGLFAAACSGRSVDDTTTPSGSGGQSVDLATTTPAGTEPVDSIVWSVYRETNSLDPIYAFDYPENTVLSTLCETLLHQNPDGSITSGLADLSYPDDTTMVFTLKPGITFWDGKPLTPEDVVFSLERNTDPKLGGF
jgi:peptide/nickel transport system substrate-binding protein